MGVSGIHGGDRIHCGKSTTCVFYHRAINLRVVVHGDDFAVLAMADHLDWYREQIVNKFEVKFRGRLGAGDQDQKAIRILNRITEWSEEGIVYEADRRHVELIIRD